MKTELLHMVRERSYKSGPIQLVSGKTSDFYVDMKNTLLHPKGIHLVSNLILEILKPISADLVGVGGMTMGADPIATGVSMASLNWDKPLLAFYIRKEPKKHGTEEWVEGIQNFKEKDSVYIMEDVVTTGGSSLKAVERARLAGLNVMGIVTCVDREEGGRDKIESAGLQFNTLLTKSEIVG